MITEEMTSSMIAEGTITITSGVTMTISTMTANTSTMITTTMTVTTLTMITTTMIDTSTMIATIMIDISTMIIRGGMNTRSMVGGESSKEGGESRVDITIGSREGTTRITPTGTTKAPSGSILTRLPVVI